jgi:hypothetical protein
MKKLYMQEVFDVIKTEREYQDAMIKKSDRPDMVPELNVGATLTAIRHNLRLAEEEWYKGSAPHQSTMGYLRKIAGLIVQAGEVNGMPERPKVLIDTENKEEMCKHSFIPKAKNDCNYIFCKCKTKPSTRLVLKIYNVDVHVLENWRVNEAEHSIDFVKPSVYRKAVELGFNPEAWKEMNPECSIFIKGKEVL